MYKQYLSLLSYLSPLLFLFGCLNDDNRNNNHLLVGYIQPQYDIKMSTATQQGYDILAIAFGNIYADKVTMSTTNCNHFPEGCFVAYLNEEGDDWLTSFSADLIKIKQNGALVLLSFGSGDAVNTFQPVDPDTGYNVDADLLAHNIIDYTYNTLGIDGVDFDLERMTGDEFSGTQECCETGGINECSYDDTTGPNDILQACRQAYFYDLLSSIDRQAPSLILTAPPQININEAQTGLDLVNTAHQKVFQTAIDANLFDYIFAQAYNSPYFTVNDNCEVALANDNSDYYTEYYPEFISLVYPCIESILSDNSPTKIYLGQLANTGDGALTYGTYEEIAQQYAILMEANYEHFAGAMAWSITTDAEDTYDSDGANKEPYSFSQTIKSALLLSQQNR